MRSPKSNLSARHVSEYMREDCTNKTGRQHIHTQRSGPIIEPHSQLLLQLQHQITQLLPLRNSFPNLFFYYEQLKSNYEALLNQMHQTHYMKSFTGLEGKQVDELKDKLRQAEVEYQELGEYLNLHLIEKLANSKEENKLYCQKLNTIQQNLEKLKEQRKTIMFDKDVLRGQYEKFLKQSAIFEHNCAQDKRKLMDLKISVQKVTITQKQRETNLNQLKQEQTSKHDRQSQILSDVLEKRKQFQDFTQKEKELNHQAELAQNFKKELIFHHNSSKQKLIQVETLKTLKTQDYDRILVETKLLQEEISRLEKQNSIQRKLTTEINSRQISELNCQVNVQKAEHQKAQQFLSYLEQYEKQLKQTSNLMFNQLQESCKQDFQKLLKPNPNLLNTNHTPLSIKRQTKSNHLNQPSDLVDNRSEGNFYLSTGLSDFISH